MRYLFRFLLLFLLIMGAAIGIKHYKTSGMPEKSLGPQSVILAFGDSLTYGYGALPQESYPSILEQRLHRKVINAGIPGELSEEGLRRLPSLLRTYHPKILILCHGGNDLLQKKSPDSLRYNLEQMILLARSEHTDVILVAVPEFGLLHLTPAPLYGQLAEKYRLPVESDILSSLLHDNRYKSDYIHPNAAGYEKIAEAIEKVLKESYRVDQ